MRYYDYTSRYLTNTMDVYADLAQRRRQGGVGIGWHRSCFVSLAGFASDLLILRLPQSAVGADNILVRYRV